MVKSMSDTKSFFLAWYEKVNCKKLEPYQVEMVERLCLPERLKEPVVTRPKECVPLKGCKADFVIIDEFTFDSADKS